MVLGEEESVLIREVSFFYANMVFGEEESVLISEVSLFQGLKSTQTQYLGKKKVSRLEVSLFLGHKHGTWGGKVS